MGQPTPGIKNSKSDSAQSLMTTASSSMKDGAMPCNPTSTPGVRPYTRVIVPSYVTSERILEQSPRNKTIIFTEQEVDLFRQTLQEFHERELGRIVAAAQAAAQRI
jgi:hypothetical protein